MQVNDLVKVNAEGEFNGLAGVVVQTLKNKKGNVSTVKLDLRDEPQDFADEELQFLGR